MKNMLAEMITDLHIFFNVWFMRDRNLIKSGNMKSEDKLDLRKECKWYS